MRKASVREPQNPYRRAFSISMSPPLYTWLGGIQEQFGFFGIAVTSGFVAPQQPECDQRIEEVTCGAFVQTKPHTQLGQRERPVILDQR